MECRRCGKEVQEEEAYLQGSGHLCENCYMDALSPSKACDPWAVKLAKGASAATGTSQLQGLEKELFELVTKNGSVAKEEAPRLLSATIQDIERSFSVLRHMELLRARRRSDAGVDIIPFNQP